jgi:hypothetical protein
MMSRCASSSSPKCSRISLLRCTHSAHAHWGTQARACANDVQTIQTRRATREQQHERTGARAQSATADGCAAPPRCHPGRQTLCRCRAAAATHTHTHTQHTHTARDTVTNYTRVCGSTRLIRPCTYLCPHYVRVSVARHTLNRLRRKLDPSRPLCGAVAQRRHLQHQRRYVAMCRRLQCTGIRGQGTSE